MSNLKNLIETAVQGNRLGLLLKVELYCNFKTFGRDNFNVRCQFHTSQVLQNYCHSQTSQALSLDGNIKHNSEKNIQYDLWSWRCLSCEEEYVVRCEDLYQYCFSCQIISDVFNSLGIELTYNCYKDDKVPFTKDQLKIQRLQDELQEKIEIMDRNYKRAQNTLHNLLFGKWIKKEFKNAETVDEILKDRRIAKAIADINILKRTIKKYKS